MKKIPLRTCVGCKEVKPKKELIRVVKQSDGKIMLDFTGKANGRGAYLCPNADCLAQAIKTELGVDGDLTVADLQKLTKLSAKSLSIQSLKGLEIKNLIIMKVIAQLYFQFLIIN